MPEAYDFLPIDIYQADARRFQIIDGKLMPALKYDRGSGRQGCGCRCGCGKRRKISYQKMISADRTKVSKTVIDLMDDLGILGDLPESNQLSLFDLVG